MGGFAPKAKTCARRPHRPLLRGMYLPQLPPQPTTEIPLMLTITTFPPAQHPRFQFHGLCIDCRP